MGSGDGCDVSATVDTSKRAVTRILDDAKKNCGAIFFWRKKKFDVWKAAPAVTLKKEEKFLGVVGLVLDKILHNNIFLTAL